MKPVKYDRDASTLRVPELHKTVEALGLLSKIKLVKAKKPDADGSYKNRTQKKEYIRVLQKHFVQQMYGKKIPKRIRDAIIYRPMLATPMAAHSDISVEAWTSDRWFAEEKIHGYRTTTGFDRSGSWCYSRFLSNTDFLPVQHPVPFDVNSLKVTLDVEVCADNEDDLRELLDASGFPVSPAYNPLDVFMSLTYEDQKKILHMKPDILKYYILDVLETEEQPLLHSKPLADRLPVRADYLQRLINLGVNAAIPTSPDSNSQLAKQQFFAQLKANGAEGMVLKNLDGIWVPGKRSKDWQKVKNMKFIHDIDTLDAFIVDWEDDVATLAVYYFDSPEPVVLTKLTIPGGQAVSKIAKSVEIARNELGAWEFIRLRPYKTPVKCTYSLLNTDE